MRDATNAIVGFVLEESRIESSGFNVVSRIGDVPVMLRISQFGAIRPSLTASPLQYYESNDCTGEPLLECRGLIPQTYTGPATTIIHPASDPEVRTLHSYKSASWPCQQGDFGNFLVAPFGATPAEDLGFVPPLRIDGLDAIATR